MRRLLVLTLAAGLILGLSFIANAIHEVIPSETMLPEPGPNAEKLNEYIVRYKPYTSWQMWPGKGRLYPGKEPHGSLLTTFVNDAAYYSIKEKKGMSDGSMIAKENYTADKKFVALTVMYKIKGYNPAGGDWFWVKYAPEGKVLASGKVDVCIKCHREKSDNDFIWTGEVRK
jgi:hypothetical protein